MYNEQQKLRFIDDKSEEVVAPVHAMVNFFNKAEQMETEMDKDLSMFSINEILDLYKTISSRSLDVINNINSLFGNYTSWCMSHNLVPSGINNFREITMEMMTSCVNKLAMENGILTEEEVLHIVRLLPNYREKFFVLMAYETGKTKNYEHIFKAKLSDFDFDNNIFHSPDGRTVKVSPRLCDIAKETDITLEYIPYLETEDERVLNRKRLLIDEGYIYKETDTVKNTSDIKVKLSRVRLGLRKGFRYIGVAEWITMKEFQNSGVINHFKKIAAEKEMDIESVIRNKELRAEVENQHAISILSPKAFIRKFKEFL